LWQTATLVEDPVDL